MKYINIAIFFYIVFISLSCQSQTGDNIGQYKYPNGQIQFDYTIVDGVKHGQYKGYYEDGVVRSEGTYDNGKLEGELKTYTPNGDLAAIVIYKKGWEYEKKVYWQIVKEPNEFLFVSKEGFYTVKDGEPVVLDETTQTILLVVSLILIRGKKKDLFGKVGNLPLYDNSSSKHIKLLQIGGAFLGSVPN